MSVRALRGHVMWNVWFGGLFLAVGLLTWQRWTVQAFPLDAGREMMMPGFVLEGRMLFSEVRCLYGPLNTWFQGGLLAVFGRHQDVLWWSNAVRFAVTMVLTWYLARRLLSRPLAALGLTSFIFPFFFSLVVSYSSAIGLAVLLLVAALLCLDQHWRAWSTWETSGRLRTPAGVSRRPRLRWLALTLTLLSFAITTRHTYCLAGGLLMVGLLVDLGWRCGGRGPAITAILRMLPFAILPAAVVGGAVLTQASLSDVIGNNLWMPAYLKHHGGAWYYGPGLGLSPFEAVALVQWMGLIMIAVAVVSLLIDHPSRMAIGVAGRDDRARWRTRVWLFVAGMVLASTAQAASALPGVAAHGTLAFPKNRIRELIETSPVLCLPLGLLLVLMFARRAWQKGVRRGWLELGRRERFGLTLTLVYLAFLAREVPSGTELTRHVLTPIVFTWLLAVMLPRWFVWRRLTRHVWAAGAGALLIASTFVAVDNIYYLQTRPSTWLHGRYGSMFAWQRRKPFTPQWFEDGLATVQKHRALIGDGNIACVPQGGFINALTGLPWPVMRDNQWEPQFSQWINEDLRNHPPDFVLVMDTEEVQRDYPVAWEILSTQYTIIETNASGMPLLMRNDLARSSARTGLESEQGADKG